MPFDETLLEPVSGGFDPALLEPVEDPRETKRAALQSELAKEAKVGERAQTAFSVLSALEPIVEPFTASGMLNQPSRALGMPDPFQPGVGVVETELAKHAAELSPVYQLLKLTSPGKEGAAEGVRELIGKTLSAFTTPESIVTLPAAGGAGPGPALVRTAFATEMGRHLPEQVQHAVNVLQDPNATTKEKVVAVGDPTISAGMIGAIGKHAYDRPTARIVTQEPVPQRTPFPPEATPEEAALFAQEFRVPKEPVVKEQAPPPKEAPEAAGEVKLAEAASPAPAPQPAVTPEAVTSQAVGMGGAVPSEFQQTPKTATGIKNATVDAERTARGLPPAMQVARRGFGTVWDETMAAIDRDPGLPDRLIAELREKPRALTDAEDATLLHRQIDLQNEYGKATRDLAQAFDDGRLADVEAEKLRVQGLSDQLLDLYNINKRVGTETGRGLNARKMMAYEDFSLARMELEKRAANEGAPLTHAQRTEIQSLHDRIAETQRKYDEYVAKAESAERQRVARELIEKAPQPRVNPYVIQVAERIVGALDKRADAARIRLREKMARASAGVDPTILADLAEIGASHLGHVGLDFAKWSARMIEDVGEWSREHLEEVFKRSQALIDSDVASKVPDKSRREGVKNVLQGYKTRLERQTQELQKRIESGDFSKRVRKKIELDDEAIDLKAANEKAKAEYHKSLHRDMLSRRSIPRKIWDGIKKTRGAIVNIKSSFDFSAPRQALTAILGQIGRLMIPLEIARTPEGKLRPSFINPAQTVKSAATHFQRMFQAWASAKMADRIEKRIQGRRNAENGADKAMGIEYTDLESPSFTRYEENAHSILDEWAALPFKTGNLPKTIATAGPKAGAKMVRMSNRAFITFLNSIRADLVDTQLRIHFKDRPPTDIELKTLGNAINVATGRGKLSPITARVASEVLWAPKLLASRVQTLTGQPLWGGAPLKGSGRARAIIAQEYARIIAGGYLLWTVSRLFDEKDETDLRSSDFGKIVRDDTRIDPWGGLQQVTTLGARIASGKTKNVKGKTLKADLGDLLQNFARSKLRPDVGVLWDAWDIAFDKVRAGHPETFGEAGRELFTPLPLQDITTIMKEHGFTEGMIIEALQQFGAGVSHYEQKAQR